ncbi:bifunctional 2-polyprenyl-6-hydroxyphenol methylase/3-demethylubiquinol 3-O-methyltransferase UbiG [Phenylobacterium sp.]|uniref:class I SAM-dependent methyltransferase n=1 Tax=Phenylobacterium sp. TaxID=1871053 RepID=UPI0025F58B95|nr:class I SAM-dependent methyltransferase [Phenylobacterium sp.]
MIEPKPSEPAEPRVATIQSIYEDKPVSYFANARADIVAMLPTGPDSAILELGCGAGGTGRAVLEAGKAGRYVGLELSPVAGAAAAEHLSEVLVGDVEALDLAPLQGAFDALIVSEVLEHLTDPWTTLKRLAGCLKPGGRVYASSPNVANWKVIRGLLRGRFDYADKGVMDRTHLRWFTPDTYADLFRSAGFEVLECRPVTPLRSRSLVLDRITGGRLRHLLFTQIMVVAQRPGAA